ncbi:hypothetical protein LF65_00091 [Clostridium beijerinckii]|uniref:Uncharacterized protein n=1 Tax=Clostridium beijerinckii TaxID=1520 RepID=A0A0B5QFN7_CLOBE|nr:hypothetical protein [Clostridium beijerinckii]AJG96782.1 hypothetical protein LF65_00091 [Clostridium beijerinckii]
MENMERKKKFHERTWFCILMLLLICPAGVFLLWKNKIFNKVVRVVLSVIAIPVTFVGVIFWMAMFNPRPYIEKSKQDIAERNEEASKNSSSKSESKLKDDSDIENKSEDNKNDTSENNESAEDNSNINKADSIIKNIYEQYKKSSEPKTEEFLRDPDSFAGKNIMYSGKIVQVLEGNEETPTNIIIENNIDGKKVNILYDRKQGQPRYLENDYITVLGVFDRIEGMESLAGESIPMPIIDCTYIDFSYNMARIVNACKTMDSLNKEYRLEMTDKTYNESNGKAGNLFKVYYLDTSKYDSKLLYSNGFESAWYTNETNLLSEFFFKEKLDAK